MKEQSYNHNPLFLSPQAKNGSSAEDVWAVILAGATNRTRRDRLTPARLRGGRPKHFCRTLESDFIINQTRKQTALHFTPEKTLFVVTREDSSYYDEVLGDVPPKNLIVQPQDDGSLFAVLYAALRLEKTNPSAVLAFFPADFQVADAQNFMARVESAISAVRLKPELILLGVKAESPDTERDWVELDPDGAAAEPFNVWRVRRFWHQPTREEAQELRSSGALWNSSVMVGTAATFLRKIRRAAPEVYAKFGAAESKIGTPGEERAIEKAYYSNFVDTDFARDVLAKSADELAVIPVPGSKRSAVVVKRTASISAPADAVALSAQNYAVARAGV